MAEVGIGILVQCKPLCLFAGCAVRGLPKPITTHTVETVFTAGTDAEGARLVFTKWRRDDLLTAAALGHSDDLSRRRPDHTIEDRTILPRTRRPPVGAGKWIRR